MFICASGLPEHQRRPADLRRIWTIMDKGGRIARTYLIEGVPGPTGLDTLYVR